MFHKIAKMPLWEIAVLGDVFAGADEKTFGK
jgi:hypothetical protein